MLQGLGDALRQCGLRPRIAIGGQEASQDDKKRYRFILNLGFPKFDLRGGGPVVLLNLDPVGDVIRPAPGRRWEKGRWLMEKKRARLIRAWRQGFFNLVFDYNPATTKTFRSWGWPSYFFPWGYHPSFEVSAEPLDEGVYLLGRTTPFRRKMMRRLGGQIVQCFDDTAYRSRLLRTPGVHVNIQQVGLQTFPVTRILNLLLPNRRCVLSESLGWSPLEHGRHYLEFDAELVPDVCERLMRDRAARERLGQQGYEFVKKCWRLEDNLRHALNEAELL